MIAPVSDDDDRGPLRAEQGRIEAAPCMSRPAPPRARPRCGPRARGARRRRVDRGRRRSRVHEEPAHPAPVGSRRRRAVRAAPAPPSRRWPSGIALPHDGRPAHARTARRQRLPTGAGCAGCFVNSGAPSVLGPKGALRALAVRTAAEPQEARAVTCKELLDPALLGPQRRRRTRGDHRGAAARVPTGASRGPRPAAGDRERHDADPGAARSDGVVGVADPGRDVVDRGDAGAAGAEGGAVGPAASWLARRAAAGVWFESRLPSPKTTSRPSIRRIGWTTWACWPTTAVIVPERASRLRRALERVRRVTDVPQCRLTITTRAPSRRARRASGAPAPPWRD